MRQKPIEMVLAAIDIGSNAIRLQVVRVIQQDQGTSFKKLEYIRFPLRLGKDVFNTGQLSDETIVRFEKLMRTFKLFLELYEVDGYIAAATSALRESKNGRQIAQQIATYFNLKIDIISGSDEAEILSKAIIPNLDERTYVHIDVGGGSTELNIYIKKQRVDSKSFKVGSVRQLTTRQRNAVFKQMREWCQGLLEKVEPPISAIGTGGNIRKLFKLSNFTKSGSITLTELQALQAYLGQFTYEQRMNMLKMNPDRADVIIPASEIYTEVMKTIGADKVMVPNVGLKDGLLYKLYEDMIEGNLEDVEFLDEF